MIDLLLRDAVVWSGDGDAWRGDVAVRGGAIVAAGRDLDLSARRVISLSGLDLAPGFIDMHSHSALRPFADPSLTPKISQGFTTELINQDGLGPAPVTARGLGQRQKYLRPFEGAAPAVWTWRSLEQYFDALGKTRPATTLCPLVPHGAVREITLGTERRRPTGRELRQMRAEVARGMEAGAWGVSFGLLYHPAVFAEKDELVAVAEECARYDGLVTAHIRSESRLLLESVEEMLEVARRSGARLNISHLKVCGRRNAWKLDQLLLLLDEAARGVDVTFDQYPYPAGATSMTALLPPWALEGGSSPAQDRLHDVPLRRQIIRDMWNEHSSADNLFAQCGPDFIVVADFPEGQAEGLLGRTIAYIADERSQDPAETVIDLLVEAELESSVILHYADEELVRRIAAHPLMLVGTDGIFAARPHPRLWGTSARFLGRWVIRDGLISVREAIARLTVRAARRIGLDDRGEIKEGLRADLVAFDSTRLIDQATFEDPERASDGIEFVVVAGKVVLDRERPVGQSAGSLALRDRPGRD